MKKIFNWSKKNLLFLTTAFLLIFIPLYPKLPLLDVKNTWVYVRIEDFIVVTAVLIWTFFILTKKVSLKTPLTVPILAYWILGGIATLHGILLIFPNIANVFPNVAFLAYVRHIEYVSLFFIAFASVRSKNDLKFFFVVVLSALIGVILYGIGQKYLALPAYLTMNEEFAKGVPIQLSSLSRVPSTFAGHYDLAAYLVLILPIVASAVFGIKNLLSKFFLALVVVAGTFLMIMTVSRVSFLALLASLFFVLLFQKKKLVIFSVPIILVLIVLFASFNSNLLLRYTNTVSKTDVLVNAITGEAIGNIEYVPASYFLDKRIKIQRIEDNQVVFATTSAVSPVAFLPPDILIPLVKASNISTGETLPQGTGYVNLSLSPVEKRVGDFYYELSPDVVKKQGDSFDVVNFQGNFVIKSASAYDLSFTTRLQGEWPNAITAFKRNIFLGSGYGSVSLAIDNNFLRMLAETGLLGTTAFFGIFIVMGMYIKSKWQEIESKFTKSIIVGYVAGAVGLFLNATLIDVFEASKVAFVFWLLTGVILGATYVSSEKKINVYVLVKKAASSTLAYVLYIATLVVVVFLPLVNNFFIGDDFTWFRWAEQCGESCKLFASQYVGYFTNADGFFFRPGPKIYFSILYHYFWLNQAIYHSASILLHFLVALLFFAISVKILKNKFLAAIISMLFVLMSGYAEVVFWISTTGYLFTSLFILISLYLFMMWQEQRRSILYILSLFCAFLATIFHELGVVVPIIILSYSFVFIYKKHFRQTIVNLKTLAFFIPVFVYMALRVVANSHWFNGDYSYDLLKLPFNIIGNSLGYIAVTFVGPIVLPIFSSLRTTGRDQILLFAFFAGVLGVLGFFAFKYLKKIFTQNELDIMLFGFLFFGGSLLPFIGLGTITERYSYLASLGLLLIFAVCFKKIYEVLLYYGKDIAIGFVTTFLLVFSIFHVIQVQKLHNDWRAAGEMVEQFFISVDAQYANEWSDGDIELHFVNVPIRHGDAWVFPVGLGDALFLSFKNENMKVFQHPTVEQAQSIIGKSKQNKIFEFQPDGSLKNIPTYLQLQQN